MAQIDFSVFTITNYSEEKIMNKAKKISKFLETKTKVTKAMEVKL